MGEGLHFASLATLVGKYRAAKFGKSRVTIVSVGNKSGSRFVMGLTSRGVVVLGEPSDFTIVPQRKPKV